MSNNFCSNCGAPLSSGAKFCGKCGTKLINNTTPTTKPVSSAKTLQEYKYIIPAQYRKGLLSTKACTLIFTEAEIIVAIVDNKLMKQHINEVRESVKGEKFTKRTATVMKAGYTFSDRYWKMSRNSILCEANDNFVIACNTIQLAKFTKGSVKYYNDDTTSNIPPAIMFKTVAGKYAFNFNLSVDTKTFIPMLQSIFPGRYKGPKK